MANILAFDTSSESCSVAVVRKDNPKEIWSDCLSGAGQHSRHILELIKSVLEQADLAKTDLDAVAVTVGPGSFTGLRVACSVAQGLAYALEIPIIALTSLEVLALQAKQKENRDPEQAIPVLAMLDARMGELYWGAYHFEADTPVLLDKIQVTPPEDVNAPEGVNQIGVIGPGLRYEDAFSESFKAKIVNQLPEIMPDAKAMIPLALQKLSEGKTIPALSLEPLYIRDEVTWKKYQPTLKILDS